MARGGRGASRSKQNANAGNWFGGGFVCGVLATLLLWSAVGGDQSGNSEPPAEATDTATVNDSDTPATKFDFFTLLPEREVIVPDEETRPVVSATAAPVSYSLQAGSFRQSADADKRRARILLLGLDARVETVKNSDGNTWHRVLVGPLTSRSAMAKARNMLISENIETLLLKNKG